MQLLLFRAGSRHESADKLGTAHLLAVGAELSNKNSTEFGIRVNVDATGGDIKATAGRESIIYNVVLNREEVTTGLKYLQDVATQQSFRPWELRGLADRVNDNLSRVPSSARAVDLLHQAAFYRGLGNSVYCGKHNIGNISPTDLESYVASNFTADRATVVGVGVDHELLIGYAKSLQLEGKASAAAPSKYVGGQLKVDESGSTATIAVATQGASLANQKEALAFVILRNIAGGAKVIPNGGPTAALDKVVKAALKNPYEFSALNASYSDNGLFGFVLQADAREAGKVSVDVNVSFDVAINLRCLLGR